MPGTANFDSHFFTSYQCMTGNAIREKSRRPQGNACSKNQIRDKSVPRITFAGCFPPFGGKQRGAPHRRRCLNVSAMAPSMGASPFIIVVPCEIATHMKSCVPHSFLFVLVEAKGLQRWHPTVILRSPTWCPIRTPYTV